MSASRQGKPRGKAAGDGGRKGPRRGTGKGYAGPAARGAKTAARAGRPRRSDDATAATILATLHELYPDARVELLFDDPLQLLVATILSAQATDQRVNAVTRDLFRKYRTAADYAAADPATFEVEIHSTGFFRNKTKLVLGAARRIVDAYGGEVPDSMAELVTLPGVARKTANVVLGSAFGKAEGVVVDTHVTRVAFRLGLTLQQEPAAIESELMERLEQDEWTFAGHALILHGRRVCVARKPRCSACALLPWCPRNGVTDSE